MLPERSEDGLAALDVFFRDLNEVNVYVEDIDQENLYHMLLSKVFPLIRIEKIFPLGGKQNVLKHSKDPANSFFNPRVYIVDKDFDDLLGKEEKIAGLYYLDKFCIENYFIEKEAIIEFIVETLPKKSKRELKDKHQIESVVSVIVSELKDLFALFFIIQKEGLGIPNCGEKPEKFCVSSELWRLSSERLESLRKEIQKICVKCDCPLPAKPLSEDPRLSTFYKSCDEKIISGKFVLAMIFHYLKKNFSLGSITFDSFVYRIAKNTVAHDLRSFLSEIREFP